MRLLLGVSGSIAAYKALEVVRAATADGHAVRVVQSPTSERFVGRASFAALSGAPVLVSEFDDDPARGAFPGRRPPDHAPISHLALAAAADAYLIAPASAHTLAKLAHGLADNLLCAAALAARCPLVLAPAMNDAMWEAPATRANLALLRQRGATVVEPETGALASAGEWGTGRLAAPEVILGACTRVVAAPDPAWAGVRVLVSAGGTREPIDAVRYVGNRSSGRMGFALAAEAARRGAAVTVVAANVSLPTPPGVRRVDVSTAADLADACRAELPASDVVLMAAAVADFRPVAPTTGKLARDGRRQLDLRLESTEDVLAALRAGRRDGQLLVGFAAEHGPDAVRRGREKLARKGVDLLVVNDVSDPEIGFDVLDNAVTLLRPDAEPRHVGRAGKDRVAAAILDAAGAARASRGARTPPPAAREV